MTYLRMMRVRNKKTAGDDVAAMPLHNAASLGTVKWFNVQKGYGFIAPADGSDDVFVGLSAIQRSGLHTLEQGQLVTYQLSTGKNGRERAEWVKVM